jgi:hypothetical protein
VRSEARAKKNTRKQLSLPCPRHRPLPPAKFPLFLSQNKAHHCGQTRCKNGAKPHSSNTCGLCLHHMGTVSMPQNTHLEKENKFPLLEMKMKIYLHKL